MVNSLFYMILCTKTYRILVDQKLIQDWEFNQDVDQEYCIYC